MSALGTIGGGPALLDVTPINKPANVRIGGLRDGDMQFTSFWDYSDAVSAPGFPLTTVPVTNTTGAPVFVDLSSGTVTEVYINSVSAGTTDGYYLLPAGGTISVTYTGSPTWTWTAQGAAHNILSSLPTSDTIASYFRGTTLLNPCASIHGKQLNYDPTRDASGNLTLAVEVQAAAYGLEWGVMLTPGLRNDTAATAGAYVDDNGAGTAFGAQAYLQLIEIGGTSVDVSITHCATSGGSYASLIDFGALTGPGAVRMAVSNTTTVNRYLKVVTTGTFTYALFAVHWTRNPVAGIVF